MYHYSFLQWLAFFYIYSFFGWIFESSYVSVKNRRLVNRGFLRLPLLPLYGTGAVMMLWVSLPVQNHLFLVYISGVIAATILEYITGCVMEHLFKIKYWDYSDQRFQYKGYICLSSSIAWGFLTILLTEILHRPVSDLVLHLTLPELTAGVCIISVFFVCDTFQSVREALKLGQTLESLTQLKTELEELQVQLALLKAETTAKLSQAKEDRMEDLNLRIQHLTNKRKEFTSHISFYHRGLLKGNPSAVSKRFNAALSELKDFAAKRRTPK